MGNLIKLGNMIINKNKILKAQIYKVTYPVLVLEETPPGKKKGFFSTLFDIVDTITGDDRGTVKHIDTLILNVIYESEDGNYEISLYNDQDLAKLVPSMIDLYNERYGDVEMYRASGGSVPNPSPSKYTFEVCDFIDSMGNLSYINQDLDYVLNNLV